MNRTRLYLTLFALNALPLALPAQEAVPATPSPDVNLSSNATSAAPKKERAISKDLSHALSAGIKYNPPPPPKPVEEDVDLRDIDKPKNGIIRLPKYVVEGQRPPVFNTRNLYSKEMLRRLAYQKYISSFSRNVLNRYHILGHGDVDYAMMQYEADERKRNMDEMADKVSMYRVSGDNAEAAKLKDDSQRTFMRRSDSAPATSNQSNSGQ
jgi:hypothetical protein